MLIRTLKTGKTESRIECRLELLEDRGKPLPSKRAIL